MVELLLKMIITINRVSPEGIGEKIGTVTVVKTDEGVTFKPNLSGINPGEHGFHIHTNPDCGADLKDGVMSAAEKAGPHYDPSGTHKHEGPHGSGHKGDLPFFSADKDGNVTTPVIKSGLTFADIRGRSLIIHESGDNYSDIPKPLGGGGKRIACGVIASN